MSGDTFAIFFVATIWVAAIVLILYLLWQMQKERAQKQIDEIELTDKQIEEDINSESLSGVVSDSNSEEPKS